MEKVSHPIELWFVRYVNAIKQNLGHAWLEFFTKRPLPRGRVGCGGPYAIFSLSVFVLVIGKIERCFIGVVGVETHANAFAFSSGFGGDHDDPILGTRAVQGRRSGPFEDGHAFDVVGVDAGKPVAPVRSVAPATHPDGVVSSGVAGVGTKVGVVDGYTIDNDQWIVLPGNGRLSPDADLGSPRRASPQTGNVYPGDFALQGIHKIGGTVFSKGFSANRSGSISQFF